MRKLFICLLALALPVTGRGWSAEIDSSEMGFAPECSAGGYPDQCPPSEKWLDRLISGYEETLLSISEEVADRWGQLNAERSQPVIGRLIAATALEFGLTVATRNTGDFPAEVKLINPWEF